MFQNDGFIFVNVNIQSTRRHLARDSWTVGIWSMTGDDFDWKPCALFAPNQGHFGAETKLAARLSHPILAARQDATEQVGYRMVRHTTAIVLDGYQKVAFLLWLFAALFRLIQFFCWLFTILVIVVILCGGLIFRCPCCCGRGSSCSSCSSGSSRFFAFLKQVLIYVHLLVFASFSWRRSQ
jgi:hypothetical protein